VTWTWLRRECQEGDHLDGRWPWLYGRAFWSYNYDRPTTCVFYLIPFNWAVCWAWHVYWWLALPPYSYSLQQRVREWVRRRRS